MGSCIFLGCVNLSTYPQGEYQFASDNSMNYQTLKCHPGINNQEALDCDEMVDGMNKWEQDTVNDNNVGNGTIFVITRVNNG